MIITRRRIVSNINKLLKKFEKKFVSLNSISLSKKNILHNFDLIKQSHPTKEVWPVLKANAYGHGLRELIQILKERKFTYAVVDAYFEALRIWEHTDQQVLLIGSINPRNFKNIDFNKCAIVAQDLHSIKTLGSINKNIRIHLKINTGMNRQGIEPKELDEYVNLIQYYKNLEIEGVCSHFADADNTDKSFTSKQERIFEKTIKEIKKLGIKPRYIHLAATGGSARLSSNTTNTIRLGLGLYGYNPIQHTEPKHEIFSKLKPALSMSTTITKIRTIEKSEKVGYNITFTSIGKMRIGVLSCGYHEGIPRSLSNKGHVQYNNTDLQIIGRISMNLTTINLADTNAKEWDKVQIINPDQSQKNSITHIANITDTSVYEIITGLDESIRRKIT